MDALAAANADAQEVSDAISMGADMAQADAGVDDSDLEAELQRLVSDVEAETTRKRLEAEHLAPPVQSPVAEDAVVASEREKVPVAL